MAALGDDAAGDAARPRASARRRRAAGRRACAARRARCRRRARAAGRRGRAGRTRRRPAARSISPMKPATKGDAGGRRSRRACRPARCVPWLRTTMRSASSSASSWSWVTKTVVWPVRSWISRSQRRRSRAHLGVERAEGLVEQQDARLDGERAGERDALALAAGELRRDSASRGRRAGRGRAAPRRACGSRRVAGRRARGRTVRPKAMLSKTRHVAEERIVLEDEADVALAARSGGARPRRRRERGRRSAGRARRGCAGASSCPSPTGRAAPRARRARCRARRRAAPECRRRP